MRHIVRQMMNRYHQATEPTGGTTGTPSGQNGAPPAAPGTPAVPGGSGGNGAPGTGPTVPTVPPTPAPEKPKVTFTPEQQAEINRIMAEERDRGKTQAQKDFDKKLSDDKAEAERLQAVKDGDLAKQLKLAEDRRVEAENKLKERDDEALRLKASAKYKLPEGWHARLKGTTEAEYDADAKSLAAQVAPPKPPKMENGEQPPGDTTEIAKTTENKLRATGRYNF